MRALTIRAQPFFLAALLASCGGRTGLSSSDEGSGGAAAGPASGGSGGEAAATGSGGSGGSARPPPDPIDWRKAAPLCANVRGELDAVDVWSDGRGVFVLVSQPPSDVIFLNGGRAWKTFAKGQGGKLGTRLTGFVDGPVVKFGGERLCAVEFIDQNGRHTCSTPSGAWAVFPVKTNLAYGILGDSLVIYDGTEWTEYVSRLNDVVRDVQTVFLHSIWADEDYLLVGGSLSWLFRIQQKEVSPDKQPDLGLRFHSVWGFGTSDLWAGSGDGRVFRYDGNSWEEAFRGATSCVESGVREMWGLNGVLFFRTDSEVWKLENGQPERLHQSPCSSKARVTGIWGNSPTEFFIVLEDAERLETACGAARALRYDGRELHEL